MADKIYYEDDKLGRHKVIEKPNGIKIRLLKEPSQFYIDKMAARAAAQAVIDAAAAEAKAREQLIQAKMRELAITELEKEGKI